MKLWQAILFALCASVVAAAFASAQKAERGTIQWTVSVPSGPLSDYHTLHIMDMTGVCVYIFDGSDQRSGLAVIPKTQLPQGAGCQ